MGCFGAGRARYRFALVAAALAARAAFAAPPIAEIADPPYAKCVCGVAAIQGRACPIGVGYGSDRLESRPVTAAPADPWTTIGTSSVPMCATGVLYNWNTAVASPGDYFLRLTVTDAAGVSSTAVTVVRIDHAGPNVALDQPAASAVIGGNACLWGTVSDGCSPMTYTAGYGPAGGPYLPVDPLNITYGSAVYGNQIATWNTKVGVPDGNYQLRVWASDGCANATTVLRNVIVDNTPPVALIATPAACSAVGPLVQVVGTVTDANLQSWTLQYTGGASHAWVTLGSGTSTITNGTLAFWNISGLQPCAYLLRLTARDRAALDCTTSGNVAEYYQAVLITVGGGALCCDVNRDGVGNGLDVQAFVNCVLHGTCP
ncbi:MAG: hypothetical protein U1A27_12865 [Phycisphaerae bacterium]